MSSFTQFLKEFFVLCKDGVWHVSCLRLNGASPTVIKIATRPMQTANRMLKPGTGTCVAITRQYIALYHQKIGYDRGDEIKLQLPEQISPNDLSWQTGAVVSLFLRKEDALEENKKSSLEDYSLENGQHTAETFREIGENHPVFVIARNNGKERLAFSSDIYAQAGIRQNSVPTFPKSLLVESLKMIHTDMKRIPQETRRWLMSLECISAKKLDEPVQDESIPSKSAVVLSEPQSMHEAAGSIPIEPHITARAVVPKLSLETQQRSIN